MPPTGGAGVERPPGRLCRSGPGALVARSARRDVLPAANTRCRGRVQRRQATFSRYLSEQALDGDDRELPRTGPPAPLIPLVAQQAGLHPAVVVLTWHYASTAPRCSSSSGST